MCLRLLKTFFVILISPVSLLWGDNAESVRILVLALQNADASLREQACVSLAALGSDASAALPALQAASFKDPDPNVQREAVHALGKLMDVSDSAFAAVVMSLNDPSSEVRSAALAALAAVDSPAKSAIGPVSDAFVKSKDDPLFRYRVLEWFDKFSTLPPEALPAIMEALKSHDPMFQHQAARRASLLSGLSEDQQRQLKSTLRTIIDEGIKPEASQDADLTFQAIRVVLDPKEPDEYYVTFLIRKASDRDGEIRYKSLNDLTALSEIESVQALLRNTALQDRDFRVRAFAVRSLQPNKDPEANLTLQRALLDSVGAVREAALNVIASTPDLRAFLCPDISKLTSDYVSSIRAKAFSLLENCAPELATKVLVAGAADPDPAIRLAAFQALNSLYQGPEVSSDPLVAALGLRRGEDESPGRWQMVPKTPEAVVTAVINGCSDQEKRVSKVAADALVQLTPLDNKYLPQVAALVLGDEPRTTRISSDCRLAAVRVLGSFGSSAVAFLPKLMSTFEQMSVENIFERDFDSPGAAIDTFLEALTLIAPASAERSKVVQICLKANSRKSSIVAFNGISRLGLLKEDAIPFVRRVATEVYDDDLKAARDRALSRIPDVAAILTQLIAENQGEEKTSKPASQAGLFEDHPTFRIRRLKALIEHLSLTRSAALNVLGVDGKAQKIVADDQNYIIAMGTWCGHSKLLAQLLANPGFQRLIPDIKFNFVFDDEWPLAEDELNEAVAKGKLSSEEARQRLASAKQAASGIQVIHPSFLKDLPGKVWFIPKQPDGLRPIPGIFDPLHANFDKNQSALVRDELLIPNWITEEIRW